METFEPVMFERPDAFPRYSPEDKIPETVRPVKVPTDVMFPCAATVTL